MKQMAVTVVRYRIVIFSYVRAMPARMEESRGWYHCQLLVGDSKVHDHECRLAYARSDEYTTPETLSLGQPSNSMGHKTGEHPKVI